MRKLAEATNKAVETTFVRERLGTLGVAVEPPERRAPGNYARNLPREVERAAAVVKAGGLAAD